MDDALFVSGLQCPGDLAGDGHRFANRDGSLRDPIRERGSVHELQHQGAHAVGVFEAMNLRDVWMIEGGEGFCLALEPRESFGVARERFRQDLQRNVTIQPRVAGAIHLAHAASADFGGDFVGAVARAGSQGHGEAILRCLPRPAPDPRRSPRSRAPERACHDAQALNRGGGRRLSRRLIQPAGAEWTTSDRSRRSRSG